MIIGIICKFSGWCEKYVSYFICIKTILIYIDYQTNYQII